MTRPVLENPFIVHPWNQAVWERLRSQYQNSTHAWLFTGPKGLGRHQLALALAADALSTDTRNQELLKAGSHPDLHVLMPEVRVGEDLISAYAQRYFDKQSTGRPKTVIIVDQVRELIQKMSTRAHSAGRKVVIITPAECMNLNAANALLKLLEEPPPDTLMILVSERTSRVPATVRSRASRLAFRPPPVELAVSWLREQLGARDDLELMLSVANGAPLTARSYAQKQRNEIRLQINDDLKTLLNQDDNPLALAARWQDLGADQVLPWVQRVLCDLIRGAMCGDIGNRFNPDQSCWITEIQNNIDITKAYHLYDRLGEFLVDLDGPLDKRLLLEDITLAFDGLRAA